MLTLHHIYKSYEDRPVLEDVSLAVNAGETIALIGENGAGKTTLLNVILGRTVPDRGVVNLHREAVGYVPQELPIEGRVGDRFDQGAEEWRATYALERTGLGSLPVTTPVRGLSGGQKTRLALAAVLAKQPEPTVLLLDEPTNNLDAAGLAWLEEFIRSFAGGIVLVSHDRAFINRVATKTVELRNAKLKQYGGNYDFYREQKEVEKQTEQNQYAQFLDDRRNLQRQRVQKASQLRQVSSETYDKIKHEDKMGFNTQRSSAQSALGRKLKAIDSKIRQLEPVDRPEFGKYYPIEIDGSIANGKLTLRLAGIAKSYSTPVLSEASLEVRGSERVSVAGPNGSGKTTLLKIAAGLLEPDSGEAEVGTNVRIGYLSQEVDGLDYGMSGFDNLRLTGSDRTALFQEARSLGLTEEDLRKKPADLSRGQQSKLGFAKLLLSANQLLILDEPTNHLDIPTRERIEAALRRYRGAMVVASHDRYFLQAVEISREIRLG